MKNNKGFTLIELLAVIVILAIIALIAVPIVLNMIKSARKSAAKSAALGYIDSVEYYVGFNQISSDTDITGYSTKLPTMTNGKVTCTKTSSGWNSECSAFFTAVDTKAKGKKPETATIVISESGKVLTGTSMVYNGYTVNYDGNEATIGGNSSSSNNNNNNNNSSSASYVYTTYGDGVDDEVNGVITQASQGRTSRPTHMKTYLRYELVNGEIDTNKLPEACLYTETYGGEICIKFNDYNNSKQNIEQYYGWNGTSSSYSGVTCKTFLNLYVCGDDYSQISIDPTDGSIEIEDVRPEDEAVYGCSIESPNDVSDGVECWNG